MKPPLTVIDEARKRMDASQRSIDRIKFWCPRAVDSQENRAVVPR